MKPPYSLTSEILSLIASISEKLGAINATHIQTPRTELRKANRIRTIQSSLGIEGNTLSIDQVTAIIDNKKVVAPHRDILEVKNAIAAYEQLQDYKATRMNSFLNAHSKLMNGLVRFPGRFRSKGAGIVKGAELTHLAPKAEMVRPLMENLFSYLKHDKDPLLVKSCVFHYELEFIHPFEDGNGRMGRLWQSVILKDLNPVFAFLPVETIIKKKQAAYYKVLQQSDKTGNSAPFVSFMLSAIDEALAQQLQERRKPMNAAERMAAFRKATGTIGFSRKDYLGYFKNISTATASRDIKEAVDEKLIRKKGDKRTAVYFFTG